MSPRSDLLAIAFADASKCANPKPTIALFNVVFESNRPKGADAVDSADEALWAVLDADYGFLSTVATKGLVPSLADQQKWAELLGWIVAGLQSWQHDEDEDEQRLRAFLLLSRTMDWENSFWSALPEEIGFNPSLMTALANIIRSTQINLSGTAGISIIEREVIDRLGRADAVHDWVTLGELYPRIFDYCDFPVLTQAVRCLRRFDFACLVSVASSIGNITTAGVIARALSPDDSLKLGLLSISLHQKFCCLYRSLDQRDSHADAVRRSLVELLVQVGADKPTWQSWMKVFNTYPPRFPTLQLSLGIALASIAPSALDAYVESLSLHLT
jgi:hypothetical protein